MSLKITYDAEPDHSVTTLTDIVNMCENQLGVMIDHPTKPRWRVVQVEVGKLKRTQRKHWRDLAVDDLRNVVEWCATNKEPLESPVGLVYLSERALEERDERLEPPERDIDWNIRRAIECEHRIDDVVSQYWIGRLTRARGKARKTVFNDWYTERWA